MDLSVRDWLIIIGALLAVAVLLDGFRRMRNERQDTIRLSSKKRREIEDELVNPELPGEARVVAVREAPPSLHQRDARQDSPADAPEAKPVQEPALQPQEPEERYPQKSKLDDDILFRDPAEEYANPSSTVDKEPEVGIEPEMSPEDSVLSDEMISAPRVRQREAEPPRREPAVKAESGDAPHELIVLNVVADQDQAYKGADPLQVLLACDLRYGRMNIFHRFEKADGSGAEQFSVANLVEPGNFDLDAIDGFSTPGVVFFMNLPGPEDSMQAYEAMLETARCLVKNLGGELRDQTHSVATKQTLEHYRQRIRDFERRQLTLM